MGKEKNFENKVKEYLKSKGCYLIKYWGGAIYTKSGVPDLLVCCHGLFIGIELKAPEGIPSDLQLYNLKNIDLAGGFALLLYPENWTLFKNFIDCVCAEDTPNTAYNYMLLRNKWREELQKRRETKKIEKYGTR